MLANFGVAFTYETFITLGLILAVPACAGKGTFINDVTKLGDLMTPPPPLSCSYTLIIDDCRVDVQAVHDSPNRSAHRNKIAILFRF